MDKKQMYFDVMRRKSDYIPLLIQLEKKPELFTHYEALLDPAKDLQEKMYHMEPMRGMKTDFVPAMESNFVECLIPSLFGAEIFVAPDGSMDCKAIFHDVEDIENIQMPDLTGGYMDMAISNLKYLMKHTPDWMTVQMSRMLSPLDAAIVLRGGDFFLDLVLEPEICAHFLAVITDTIIEVVKIFKEILGEPVNEQITVRGMYFDGLRLTNDSIVNLSPAMIEEFYFPCLKKFKEAFGNIMLHYCCTPAPSGHVIEALLNCNYVDAIDNWQGHETFFRSEAFKLQEKISICTDIAYEDVLNFDEYIKDKTFFRVPRKNGRALIVGTTVKTVEEGNALYEQWQKRFTTKEV